MADDSPTERDSLLPVLTDDGMTIGGLTRAEIDVQIATAHRYRRSPTTVQRAIETMATMDFETAMSCQYRKPQKMYEDGKQVDGFIEGPSIRFAEIVLAAWGNARVASRRTDLTERDVEATGIFHDLESNVAWAKSVRRPIVGRGGKPFPGHMIETTANAAASIALRNAILAGIPRAVWGSGYAKAVSAIRGDAKTLVNRRDEMLKAFEVLGVTSDQVYALLGVRGRADIDVDMLYTAAGFMTAIRDGEATMADLLAERAAPATPAAPARDLGAAFGTDTTKRAEAALKAAENPAQRSPDTTARHDKPTLEGATDAAPVVTASPGGLEAFADLPPLQDSPSKTATVVDLASRRQEHDEEAKADAQVEQVADRQAPATPGPLSAEAEAVLAEYRAKIMAADSWLTIKPIVAALWATPTFAALTEEQKRPLVTLPVMRCVEINDPVSPSTDPSYFRLWLRQVHPTDPDQPRDVFRILCRGPAYQKLTDAQKDVIGDEMEQFSLKK